MGCRRPIKPALWTRGESCPTMCLQIRDFLEDLKALEAPVRWASGIPSAAEQQTWGEIARLLRSAPLPQLGSQEQTQEAFRLFRAVHLMMRFRR